MTREEKKEKIREKERGGPLNPEIPPNAGKKGGKGCRYIHPASFFSKYLFRRDHTSGLA